jgi:hypothetical protein
VHPDIIYFPEGKDGYKYWMVYTPYPPSSKENPSIVRSNDGTSWTDAGITNPIILRGASGSWNDIENSDPDMIFVEDYNKWFIATVLDQPNTTNGVSSQDGWKDDYIMNEYQIGPVCTMPSQGGGRRP